MSPGPSAHDDSRSPASDLPSGLEEWLSRLHESELRAVVSRAESLLPERPTVEELLEARAGEEILEVEDEGTSTKVVKTQRCAEGCDDCPHGPYLYHVRVERRPADGAEPSLHWEFLGLVQ